MVVGGTAAETACSPAVELQAPPAPKATAVPAETAEPAPVAEVACRGWFAEFLRNCKFCSDWTVFYKLVSDLSQGEIIAI